MQNKRVPWYQSTYQSDVFNEHVMHIQETEMKLPKTWGLPNYLYY